MNDDSGRDRATVALVAAKIDSLHELTRAEFAAVQRQLDMVTELPSAVSELRERVHALQERVDDLEGTATKSAEWRRGVLPMMFIAIAGVVANLIMTISHIH